MIGCEGVEVGHLGDVVEFDEGCAHVVGVKLCLGFYEIVC